MAPRLKLLACEVMKEEIQYLLGELRAEDRFDVEWFEMGLHQQPEKLNVELKKRIAACAGHGYEAIVLMFGLCSNATSGLVPPDDSMLVIPRVHDCISIYFGSARRYLEEHGAVPGTYWFSRGFIHRSDGADLDCSALGTDFGGTDEDGQRVSAAEMRRRFTEEYGEDNAEYLMEVLVESWKKNYSRAVYLNWPDSPDAEADQALIADYAAENNWNFELRNVDFRLLRRLLAGDWDDNEFVIVKPGHTLAATNNEDAMVATAL